MSAAKSTPGPWAAMRKPPASFSDHGWRAMAMCGSEWMVAAPVSATRRVEGGVVTQTFWDHAANARRIVQCVNAHDELVSLLQQWADLDAGAWHAVRHANEKERLLEETRAAIAKATGSAALAKAGSDGEREDGNG